MITTGGDDESRKSSWPSRGPGRISLAASRVTHVAPVGLDHWSAIIPGYHELSTGTATIPGCGLHSRFSKQEIFRPRYKL